MHVPLDDVPLDARNDDSSIPDVVLWVRYQQEDQRWPQGIAHTAILAVKTTDSRTPRQICNRPSQRSR